MSNIITLNEDTINKIAAGEVIERPASIIKELVENSIDANSTSISVEIRNGGKTLISVSDNGCGIMEEDLQNVFTRHATSKIKDIEDLLKIDTLGFRGEAMPSISSVSEIELSTKHEKEQTGSYISVKNRKIIEKKKIGYAKGTNVKVKNLFYNTPARRKFLKSDITENNYITDVMEKIALSNPNISFKYISNDKLIFHTTGNGDLLSVIQSIYGIKTAKLMEPVEYSNELISISGYIGKPELSRGNSNYIMFSINKRIVKNIMLKEAIRTAYKSLLMNRRYPFTILNISINPEKIDVNVHPTKAEIKFSDNKSIFNIIYYVANNALTSRNLSYKNSFVDDNNSIIKETALSNFIPPKENNNRFNGVNEVFNELLPRFNTEADKKLDLEHSRDMHRPLKIIGQLFNTYILCQNDNNFFLIDQHAAHERIIFEDLLKMKEEKQIVQQALLVPMIIELSAKEMNNINYSIQLFDSLGFDIELFGDNTIAIRQVPIIMGHPCSGTVISELLDTIESLKENIDEIEEKALLQIACKSAIKAGDNLKIDEMIKLIEELYKTKFKYTCPHGRPTIISLSKYELEKKFKRIL
ncbi:MAG: DNA mismatch repair endonuclease MutL [Firmicutes bacterium]|nr:DNA mismatch repair endonuclease MutL [Bacillota bacterium]